MKGIRAVKVSASHLHLFIGQPNFVVKIEFLQGWLVKDPEEEVLRCSERVNYRTFRSGSNTEIEEDGGDNVETKTDSRLGYFYAVLCGLSFTAW